MNLNPKHAQFCDGLRFTTEMVDKAYQELVINLLPLSGPGSEEFRVSAAGPFLFAWSIVDGAHRLRGLVENFPSLSEKGQSPEFRDLLDKAEVVEKLRNIVQHMDSEIHRSVEAGKAVWGILRWVNRPSQSTVSTCMLVSGAMMPEGNHNALNPAVGLTLAPGQLDHVTLTVGAVTVNLSDLMRSLGRLVEAIENGLREAFKVFPDRSGSDMWIALAGEVGASNTVVFPAHGTPQLVQDRVIAKAS